MRFVHVGIHKTGSTLLQDEMFASAAECAVIGTPSAPAALHDHCKLLWSRDHGDLDLRAWQRTFDRLAGECGVASDRLALSDENLAGHMWTGYGRITIARRIAELWPEARVLIVLRNPVDYVLSAYNQYCRLGGAAALRTLLQDRFTPGASILRRLDYTGLVDSYVDLFAHDQVLVLPYELLVDDPQEFLAAVAAHCGLSAANLTARIIYNRSVGSVKQSVYRARSFLGIPGAPDWGRRSSRQPSVPYQRWVRTRDARTVVQALADLTDPDRLAPERADPAFFRWNGRAGSYQHLYERPRPSGR